MRPHVAAVLGLLAFASSAHAAGGIVIAPVGTDVGFSASLYNGATYTSVDLDLTALQDLNNDGDFSDTSEETAIVDLGQVTSCATARAHVSCAFHAVGGYVDIIFKNSSSAQLPGRNFSLVVSFKNNLNTIIGTDSTFIKLLPTEGAPSTNGQLSATEGRLNHTVRASEDRTGGNITAARDVLDQLIRASEGRTGVNITASRDALDQLVRASESRTGTNITAARDNVNAHTDVHNATQNHNATIGSASEDNITRKVRENLTVTVDGDFYIKGHTTNVADGEILRALAVVAILVVAGWMAFQPDYRWNALSFFVATGLVLLMLSNAGLVFAGRGPREVFTVIGVLVMAMAPYNALSRVRFERRKAAEEYP